MPLPLIPAAIAIGSLIAGGYGVKKGFDAKEDLDRAKSIGNDANRCHKEAITGLEKERKKTNRQFENLGKLKATIFSHQIKILVDEIKKRKKKPLQTGKLQGIHREAGFTQSRKNGSQ